MSDDATPRLSLPYLAAGQAQKHVTLNESLAFLDGLVQTSVESRNVAAQPGSPTDGALYILPASPTGADWSGKPADTVMRYEAGAWAELPVSEGCIAWVKDEDVPVFFDGADWVELTSLIDLLQNLAMLGVNATADATNKLTVSSSAVLFNHAGADSQVKVNKNAAGDTGSHLFQTAYSGRAEFGLIGGDDFKLKVSPDGSAWSDVMSVDRTSGRATFTLSALRQTQVDVFTSSGTYTVPSWARRLQIVCIGGGGGGGSGAAGTNAAARGGGGGGASGARVEEIFDVSELPASLTVTVGAGGAGGAAVTGTTNGNNGSTGGNSTVTASGSEILRGSGNGGGGGGGTAATSLTNSNFGTVVGNTGGIGTVTGNGGVGPTSGGNAPGGGGGGAGVTTGDAVGNGGDGGYGYFVGGVGHRANPGPGGTSGGAGTAGPAKSWQRGCGAGGGGGASATAANAGAGGDGGAPGGGGGGGGGARSSYNSGAGGTGGRGEVWIMAIG